MSKFEVGDKVLAQYRLIQGGYELCSGEIADLFDEHNGPVCYVRFVCDSRGMRVLRSTNRLLPYEPNKVTCDRCRGQLEYMNDLIDEELASE